MKASRNHRTLHVYPHARSHSLCLAVEVSLLYLIFLPTKTRELQAMASYLQRSRVVAQRVAPLLRSQRQGIRRLSDGKVLGSEEQAAENVYFHVSENNKLGLPVSL